MKRRLLTLLFGAGLVVVGTVAVACNDGGRPTALTIEVTGGRLWT